MDSHKYHDFRSVCPVRVIPFLKDVVKISWIFENGHKNCTEPLTRTIRGFYPDEGTTRGKLCNFSQ